MPEIKNQFTGGKMNKDLDERLIPKGEYVDAMNIQISTSEHSEVGTVQNILGNSIASSNISLASYNRHRCIGSVSDEKNDSLYWFIAEKSWENTFKSSQILNQQVTHTTSTPIDIINSPFSFVATGQGAPNLSWIKEFKSAILRHKNNLSEFVFVDNSTVVVNVWRSGGFGSQFDMANSDSTSGNLTISSGFTSWGTGYGFNTTTQYQLEVADVTNIHVGMTVSGIGLNQFNGEMVNYFPGTKVTFIENVATWTDINGVTRQQGIVTLSNIAGGYACVDYTGSILFDQNNVNPPLCVASIDNQQSTLGTYYNVQTLVTHWVFESKTLQLERDTLITGINVIDDLLFFTDNNSEPKCINIEDSIQGTDQSGEIHTNIIVEERSIQSSTLIRATEEHVAVIKAPPKNPPSLQTSTSRNGNEKGIIYGIDLQGLAAGDIINIDINSPSVDGINYKEGDTILLKNLLSYDNITSISEYYPIFMDEFEIALKINNIGSSDINGIYDVEVTISSLRQQATVGAGNDYACDLSSTEKPLYRLKFPRFATRYKYKDGQYSSFSPFSEVAFEPGNYRLNSTIGYNTGMENVIRELKLHDIITLDMPEDVIAIDILYKESDSPNVYLVDTIDNLPPLIPSAFSNFTFISNQLDENNAYNVTSENIKATLPSNQILRSYDNVPIKALAQEIIGNRIVYANYLQNYTIDKSKIKLVAIATEYSDEIQSKKSLKSLRDYEIGVVFSDKFGRETPVITSDSSKVKISKDDADKNNRFSVFIDTFDGYKLPSWVDSYKFYVKETSSDYFNLALDRWYDAKDGNVWLSFASSDRNKVDLDTYLILKKQPDSDSVTEGDYRYKILDVQNDAPNYIKVETKPLFRAIEGVQSKYGIQAYSDLFVNNASPHENYPSYVRFGGLRGHNQLHIHGETSEDGEPLIASSSFNLRDLQNEEYEVEVRINTVVLESVTGDRVQGNFATRWYKLQKATYFEDEGLDYNYGAATPGYISDQKFTLHLAETFEADVDFFFTDQSGTITDDSTNGYPVLEFRKLIPRDNLAQFDGRFFVKIERDISFYEQVLQTSATTTLITGNAYSFGYVKDYEQEDISGQTSTYEELDYVSGDGTEYYYFRGMDPSEVAPDLAASQAEIASLPHSWAAARFTGGSTMDGKAIPTNAYYSKNAWAYITRALNNSSNRGWFIDEAFATGVDIAGGPTNRSDAEATLDNIINPPESNMTSLFGGWNSASTNDITLAYNSGDDISIFPSIATSVGTHNITTYTGCYSGAQDIDGNWNNTRSCEHNIFPTISPPLLENTSLSDYQYFHEGNGVGYNETGGTPGGSGRTNRIDISHVGRLINTAWKDNARLEPNNSTIIRTTSLTGPRGSGQTISTVGYQSSTNQGNSSGGPRGGPVGGGLGNFRFELYKTTGVLSELTKTPLNNSSLALGGLDMAIGEKFRFRDDPTQEVFTIIDIHVTYKRNYSEHYYDDTYPFSSDKSALNSNYPHDLNTNLADSEDYTNNENHRVTFSLELDKDIGASGYTPTIGSSVPIAGYTGTWNTPTINTNPVVIEFLKAETYIDGFSVGSSSSPSIWETEPKEFTELDIFHEASRAYPFSINKKNALIKMPIGSEVVATNSQAVIAPGTLVVDWQERQISNNLVLVTNKPIVVPDPTDEPLLRFKLRNGSYSTARYYIPADSATFGNAGAPNPLNLNNSVDYYQYYVKPFELGLPNGLSWGNCFSFGNGVESDRIRDDFNTVKIDKGPTVSTTLDAPYEQERRQYGLIYSGIYNSNSSFNNLNQFIQAEKITKEINPSYGSIQKLYSGWGQGGDLLALCEDRVLKILANKDALFNADGKSNVTATNKVLGTATPYSGEYGISKNPQSFAVEGYRAYFTDKVRGKVMRLSMDGLTPISDHGMKSWFRDNLKLADNIVGSYDDYKNEYNVTLTSNVTERSNAIASTVTFKEDVKGWVSFKSFIPSNGISCASQYYTFSGNSPILWKHHDKNVDRNTFYNSPSSLDFSSITTVLNDQPGIVKSFNTLNYEGSQSRITENLNDNQYYNLTDQTGWFVDYIKTNKEDGSLNEFIEKEGKWFNYIKGKDVQLIGDNILITYDCSIHGSSSWDHSSFAIQGIGTLVSSAQTAAGGCTDPTQFNYNPSATFNDGSCIPFTLGCTSNTSYVTNFDPIANQDDGSCLWSGCTNTGTFFHTNGINYNNVTNVTTFPSIAYSYNSGNSILDDGSCITTVLGCTDPFAFNYNSAANTNDGSCQAAVYGCTLDTADNFYAGATNDDGSCYWYGCTIPQALNHFNANFQGFFPPQSVNYAASAGGGVFDDGSCTGGGCSDPIANNYDPSAAYNDGSCIYCMWNIGGNTIQNVLTADTSGPGLDNGQIAIEILDPSWHSSIQTPLTYALLSLQTGQLVPGSDAPYDAVSNPQGFLTGYTLNGFISPDSVWWQNLVAHSDGYEVYIYSANYNPNDPYDIQAPEVCQLSALGIHYINVGSGAPLLGCTDSTACNYDITANTDDGSCEFVTCAGCDDPTANGLLLTPIPALYGTGTYGDQTGTTTPCISPLTGLPGSCTIECGNGLDASSQGNICCSYSLYGCTDPTAFNYMGPEPNSRTVHIDDGSCIAVVEGCMDPTANNYDCATAINPNSTTPCSDGVNTDDGSCDYTPGYNFGCLDPDAVNYNPNAQAGASTTPSQHTAHGAYPCVYGFSNVTIGNTNPIDGHIGPVYYNIVDFQNFVSGMLPELAAQGATAQALNTSKTFKHRIIGVDWPIHTNNNTSNADMALSIRWNGPIQGQYNSAAEIYNWGMGACFNDPAEGIFVAIDKCDDPTLPVGSQTFTNVTDVAFYSPDWTSSPYSNYTLGERDYSTAITTNIPYPWGPGQSDPGNFEWEVYYNSTTKNKYRIRVYQKHYTYNPSTGGTILVTYDHTNVNTNSAFGPPGVGISAGYIETFEIYDAPCSDHPSAVVGCSDPLACNYVVGTNCDVAGGCVYGTVTNYAFMQPPGSAPGTPYQCMQAPCIFTGTVYNSLNACQVANGGGGGM